LSFFMTHQNEIWLPQRYAPPGQKSLGFSGCIPVRVGTRLNVPEKDNHRPHEGSVR
jgi:hypothetical protein